MAAFVTMKSNENASTATPYYELKTNVLEEQGHEVTDNASTYYVKPEFTFLATKYEDWYNNGSLGETKIFSSLANRPQSYNLLNDFFTTSTMKVFKNVNVISTQVLDDTTSYIPPSSYFKNFNYWKNEQNEVQNLSDSKAAVFENIIITDPNRDVNHPWDRSSPYKVKIKFDYINYNPTVRQTTLKKKLCERNAIYRLIKIVEIKESNGSMGTTGFSNGEELPSMDLITIVPGTRSSTFVIDDPLKSTGLLLETSNGQITSLRAPISDDPMISGMSGLIINENIPISSEDQLKGSNYNLMQALYDVAEDKSVLQVADDGTVQFSSSAVQAEALFFKIEKRDENNNLVQSFWYNDGNSDSYSHQVNFTDTQCKRGVEYSYTCFGYFAMPVHNYTQNPLTRMTLRLVKKQLFSTTCKIQQPAQPAPFVKFLNDTGKKNTVKVFLQLSSMSEEGPFVGLGMPTEQQDNDHDLYDRQMNRPYFEYSNDIGRFEVFKSTEMPTSFSHMAEISDIMTVEAPSTLPASSLVMVDNNVLPSTLNEQKKYYYMFRSINFVGYYSNPSPIFEVEKKQDANETFLSVKMFQPFSPSAIKFQKTKTMMKLMQILPSSWQTLYEVPSDTTALPDINEVLYGDSEYAGDSVVWGKKFKIRLSSTKTGRKIDFNVNFVLTKNNTSG